MRASFLVPALAFPLLPHVSPLLQRGLVSSERSLIILFQRLLGMDSLWLKLILCFCWFAHGAVYPLANPARATTCKNCQLRGIWLSRHNPRLQVITYPSEHLGTRADYPGPFIFAW